MKICIYGAGAIGGFFAVHLQDTAAELSVIARGEQLTAIRRDGLALDIAGGWRHARPFATERPEEIGSQDVVILAVKSPSLPQVARRLSPLLGQDTVVMTAGNGIPWWYFHGHDGPFRDHRLESVDPDEQIAVSIDSARVIGAVVFASAYVAAPGVIHHQSGRRILIGEAVGEARDRTHRLASILCSAGFEAQVRDRIRDDIWVKLWLNLSFNSVSLLTHGTIADIALDPGTRQIVRTMMQEAKAVAEAIGVRFSIDVETRIKQAEAVGSHKTSTLQDLERNRPLELDHIVAAVQEIARIAGKSTPVIDMVASLAYQRGRLAGLYQPSAAGG
jgi:2-dehydropantoate 2-reductase